MGEIVMAIKATHVPSMLISEQPGPAHGCRQAAIDAEREVGRRAVELGVDTFIVFDTHWLVNAGYHINCAPHFSGVYTSNELPHFIKNMPYAYPGNPVLGRLMADAATRAGVHTRAHEATSLTLEYGTLVPMRYMNADQRFKVVSISALCMVHNLADSAVLGREVRRAIEDEYDGTVAIFASGSLSHRFAQNGRADEFMHKIWDPFLGEMDHHVVGMWQRGDWKTFNAMLPMYADKCHGEGFMHDTAMLMGAMGGDAYTAPAEIVTPYFPSSGTGQINAIFAVTPIRA